MTESIYFSPSKLNQTQIDLHKSVHQQVMKKFTVGYTWKYEATKLISEFLDQQNCRYKIDMLKHKGKSSRAKTDIWHAWVFFL